MGLLGASAFAAFSLISSMDYSSESAREERFAASSRQIQAAPCLEWERPEPNDLWAMMASSYSLDQIEEAFEDIAPSLKGRIVGEGRKLINFRAQLESRVEPKMAALLIAIRLKFGFNASMEAVDPRPIEGRPYTSSKRKSFSLDDLHSFWIAMHAMPAGFRAERAAHRQMLIRVSDLGGSTLANSGLIFSDLWSYSGLPLKVYTFVHETGHRFDRLQSRTDVWRNLSGWELMGGSTTNADLLRRWDLFPADLPDACVSEYSLTNPSEDWAESVAAYRFNPELLQESSPEKYDWIRHRVFLGIEFSRTCPKTTICQQMEESVHHQSEETYLAAAQSCRYQLLPSVIGYRQTQKDFDRCVMESVWKTQIQQSFQGERYGEEMVDACVTHYRPGDWGELPASVVQARTQQATLAHEKFLTACKRASRLSIATCGGTEFVYQFLDDARAGRTDFDVPESEFYWDERKSLAAACLNICLNSGDRATTALND